MANIPPTFDSGQSIIPSFYDDSDVKAEAPSNATYVLNQGAPTPATLPNAIALQGLNQTALSFLRVGDADVNNVRDVIIVGRTAPAGGLAGGGPAIVLKGANSAGAQVTMGKLKSTMQDGTAGSERTDITLSRVQAGAEYDMLLLTRDISTGRDQINIGSGQTGMTSVEIQPKVPSAGPQAGVDVRLRGGQGTTNVAGNGSNGGVCNVVAGAAGASTGGNGNGGSGNTAGVFGGLGGAGNGTGNGGSSGVSALQGQVGGAGGSGGGNGGQGGICAVLAGNGGANGGGNSQGGAAGSVIITAGNAANSAGTGAGVGGGPVTSTAGNGSTGGATSGTGGNGGATTITSGNGGAGGPTSNGGFGGITRLNGGNGANGGAGGGAVDGGGGEVNLVAGTAGNSRGGAVGGAIRIFSGGGQNAASQDGVISVDCGGNGNGVATANDIYLGWDIANTRGRTRAIKHAQDSWFAIGNPDGGGTQHRFVQSPGNTAGIGCWCEVLISSAAIAVGDVVVWTGTKQVASAGATLNLTTIAGIALDAAGGAGTAVRIAKRGRCLANAVAGLTAGQLLGTSLASPANVQSAVVPGAGAIVGRATEATGGTVANKVEVDVILG